jgi:hypothetical protein
MIKYAHEQTEQKSVGEEKSGLSQIIKLPFFATKWKIFSLFVIAKH